jgi:glycosyltransferase involved in cell wall biosynthesis
VRRIRITYFINSLEQGGAERQLAELICGLDCARYEPSLIVCIARDHLGYALPVERIHCLDAPMFPTLTSVQHLMALLERLGTDLLHTTMGWENIFGRVAARLAHVPAVVSSIRCTELPRKHLLGERMTHRLADALIVNSVGIRDELARRASVPPSDIDVIENGVDLVRFAPLDDDVRERERALWGMVGRRVIVVPGRVCAQKNQRSVIRGLASLQKRGALPRDAKIIFAGRGSPPVYAEALRTYASLLGLGAQVEFAGVVKTIERLVAAADAVLLPSHFEGLPNAVVESMACGTPVVVSPAANVDSLVVDGSEGLVCDGTSSAAIERALERFFALGKDERAAMGSAGRAHAERRFAVERMVSATTRVYERVLAQRGAGRARTARPYFTEGGAA